MTSASSDGEPIHSRHSEETIRTAQQSCSSGDRLEGIVCLLLSSVVDGQHTDTMLICELLDPADDLIVAYVAVCLIANLSNLLHGVNDDELGIRVLPHEIFQLFVQSVPNFPGNGGKVEIGGIIHAVHHKHPTLDALEIILQRKVQNRSLMDLVTSQILPGTDMVGNLGHQERLADFGCSGKDICSCIEQPFHHRWPALISGLEQLRHGERMQVSRVCHALYLAVHFFQALLGIYNFIVDFFLKNEYTNFGICRD